MHSFCTRTRKFGRCHCANCVVSAEGNVAKGVPVWRYEDGRVPCTGPTPNAQHGHRQIVDSRRRSAAITSTVRSVGIRAGFRGGRTAVVMVVGGPVTSGSALRRRVRRATVAVVGVAAVSSIGITAGLAYANGTKDDPAADATSSPVAGNSGNGTSGNDTGQSEDDNVAQAPTTQQRAAPRVVPPQQLPSSGNGRTHARSGGS